MRLLIVGAGGHGKEIASYLPFLAANERVDLLGYLDDAKPAGPFAAATVLGGLESFPVSDPSGQPHYITAVGDNGIRRQLVHRLNELKPAPKPWTLVHQSAVLGTDVSVGEGSCVAPGVVITTHATIGSHCILNVRASVSHDCIVGDFCNINPAATICGDVTLGRGSYIGAAAVIREKTTVGDWSVIGAGAAVVSDIPPGVLAVGVPARPVRELRIPE
jgi:sugar O-acyltransferase (sialic acid O-acetyltransferase NeuD family)